MFEKILIGVDGSDGSRRAMDAAVAIAEKFGSSLISLSVLELVAPRYAGTVGEVDEAMERAESYIDNVQAEARRKAEAHGVTLEASTAHGHPAATLAEWTRTAEIDLVVVGQSGHSNVWGMFLGTTADKISRHANCSVLIVR